MTTLIYFVTLNMEVSSRYFNFKDNTTVCVCVCVVLPGNIRETQLSVKVKSDRLKQLFTYFLPTHIDRQCRNEASLHFSDSRRSKHTAQTLNKHLNIFPLEVS